MLKLLIYLLACLSAVLCMVPLNYEGGAPKGQPTRDVVVRLKGGVGPLKFASDHGLHYKHQVLKSAVDNVYLFQAKHENELLGKKGKAFFAKMQANDGVEWIEHQIKTYKIPRADLSKRVPDPEYNKQWHLEGVPGVSLNVKAALKEGFDGTGVVVAIVDDGVDVKHPDLSVRLDRSLCWDFNDGHGTDCSPFLSDGHGTAAAGLAAAARNSVCGIGTASGATLAGLRLIGGPTTDVVEATALSYKKDKIRVYSNSWGPIDDGRHFSGPGRLTKLALRAGATGGFGGKGNVYVWAAGNGRQQKDNCNRDGYANSRHTISVGAIDHRGVTAWYSEPCAELMVVVPSSGDKKGLVTSDLPGSSGYSAGDCTDHFGGTSGAAPQVAGIVAVMLQARPDLTKRDVEGVLAKSAIRVNPANAGWVTNARNYHHHHDYGFGRIDMERTLRFTKEWALLPPQKVCSIPLKRINRKIPYSMGMYGALQFDMDVSASCGVSFVEHIEVKTYIRHPHRGRVSVSIKGPEGAISFLATPNSDYNVNYPIGGWTFGSVRHWGSRAQGRWTLFAHDSSTAYGQGTADWVQLTIYGH